MPKPLSDQGGWEWRQREEDRAAEQWVCGFCDTRVAQPKAWIAVSVPKGALLASVRYCPHCGLTTLFDDVHGDRYPEARPGEPVRHAPPAVAGIYDEARACVAAGAPRAAMLACRTGIMYVAVDLNGGKKVEGGFKAAVDWLASNGWIPPNGRGWVDRIKDRGNDATHEIIPEASPAEAELLVVFLGMLLRFAYDMPRLLNAASRADRTPTDAGGG
jgi:hypothetical protein